MQSGQHDALAHAQEKQEQRREPEEGGVARAGGAYFRPVGHGWRAGIATALRPFRCLLPSRPVNRILGRRRGRAPARTQTHAHAHEHALAELRQRGRHPLAVAPQVEAAAAVVECEEEEDADADEEGDAIAVESESEAIAENATAGDVILRVLDLVLLYLPLLG